MRPETHWRARRRFSKCIWIAAMLGLAAACSDGASTSSSDGGTAASATEIALDQAPRFDLERLRGGRLDSAALAGKIAVIDFWATWCPPCEEQVPALNEFYRAHRDDGDVVVVGISVDTVGREEVATWVGEKAVEYPILLDGMPVAQNLGAPGFPTLIVVTPDGLIDSQHVGWIDVDMLGAILEDALERLRAPAPSS